MRGRQRVRETGEEHERRLQNSCFLEEGRRGGEEERKEKSRGLGDDPDDAEWQRVATAEKDDEKAREGHHRGNKIPRYPKKTTKDP